MDTLSWVLVAAIILTNAVNAFAGAFWGKQVIKAKDQSIQNLQDLLKDAREMNDVKFREILTAQKDGLKEHIDHLEAQTGELRAEVKSLEQDAAVGEKSKEVIIEATKKLVEMETQLQELIQDRAAADRLSRPLGRRFIRLVNRGGEYVEEPFDDPIDPAIFV